MIFREVCYIYVVTGADFISRQVKDYFFSELIRNIGGNSIQ